MWETLGPSGHPEGSLFFFLGYIFANPYCLPNGEGTLLKYGQGGTEMSQAIAAQADVLPFISTLIYVHNI